MAVTYLIGAGSSYSEIPLTQNISSITKEIISFCKSLHIERTNTSFDIYTNLINCLEIICELDEGLTIDSFAQRLHSDHPSNRMYSFDYKFYKESIAFLFLLFELKSQGRYDARYSKLVENLYTHPESKSSKIVSWNYDLQIEKCYGKIFDSNTLYSTRLEVGFCDFIFNKLITSRPGSYGQTEKRLYKLNGTADFLIPGGISVFDRQINEKKGLTEETFWPIFNALSKSIRNRTPFCSLYFFFERSNDNFHQEYLTEIQSDISETTAVIVIGYSFPNENKIADKFIFSGCASIENVYYQIPKSDFDALDQLTLNRIYSIFKIQPQQLIHVDPKKFIRPQDID